MCELRWCYFFNDLHNGELGKSYEKSVYDTVRYWNGIIRPWKQYKKLNHSRIDMIRNCFAKSMVKNSNLCDMFVESGLSKTV